MFLLFRLKLFISILIPAFILSSCGDSPEDIYKKMSDAKDKGEIQKLNAEFKKIVEIKYFKACSSSCAGDPVSIVASDLRQLSGAFPIRGKVTENDGKSHGADMNLSNVDYDNKTKITTVTIGSTVKKLSKEELGVTKFDVSGYFIEDHIMNHDVRGLVTNLKIDTKKLEQIKNAKLEKEKKEAAKMKMTVAQFRDYKSKIKFCKNDWKKCVDNGMLINNYSGMSDVKSYCKVEANSRAQYGSPEWGWSNFGTYFVGNNYVKTGIIKIQDNNVKFQNGFGAMKKSRVTCEFDLKSNSVIVLYVK